MNDLHTASLTAELAQATGATALINSATDRNDVDLNRISAAHDHAPHFLARLEEVVQAAVARHGHATVVTVHGWNVVQPALDIGLGCTPAADPFAVDERAAVSAPFAAGAVAGLVHACAARGLAATVGARYPARARENLLQLFTPRYRADERAAVRRLAALGVRTRALQLELGIALRWPGTWRERLVAAVCEALPALTAPDTDQPRHLTRAGTHGPPDLRPRWLGLRFVSDTLSGLVRLDPAGGRLLLFPSRGGLVFFTAEAVGRPSPGRLSGLAFEPRDDGLRVRYHGPLLRFPDTNPFLDLEDGLARAQLTHGELGLDFCPSHEPVGGDEFGHVRGTVTVGGRREAIDAHGLVETGAPFDPQVRTRVAVELDAERRLAAAFGPGGASGFLCAGGRHLVVTGGRAWLTSPDSARQTLAIEVVLEAGERLACDLVAVDSLPVLRGGTTPRRFLFATCRIAGGSRVIGWFDAAHSHPARRNHQ
jgi:hypothetical protein